MRTLLSRLLNPRPAARARRRPDAPVHAEVLEDRTLMTWNGLHDFEVVGRAANGEWWSGGYDAEPQPGETTFQNERFAAWNAGVNWQTVRHGDFDGDGLDDMAGRDPASGDWYVSLSNGEGSTLVRAGNWSTGTTWSDVLVADLAAPGDRAIGGDFLPRGDLIGRAGDGTWWAAVSNGDGTFTNVRLAAWNPNAGWRDVTTINFNRDGATDIIGRDATGTWWVLESEVGPDAPYEGLTYRTVLLAQWNEAAGWRDVRIIEGFFGNYKMMVLVARTAAGDWWSQEVRLGQTLRYLGHWNEAAGWRDVMTGNFVGDDDQELVGRTATGEWWMGRWTAGGFVTTRVGQWAESAGWRDVRVVSPDYQPVVVGRAANGEWYLSRIPTGQAAFTTLKIGTWTEAAGWRDVCVARVTRSPVAFRKAPNGVGRESMNVHIMARRSGASVTVYDAASTGVIRYGIRIVYQDRRAEQSREFFVYPSTAAAGLTVTWLINFNGHAGNDVFENLSSKRSLAYGSAGNDILRAAGNGVADFLDGDSGIDTVVGGPEDIAKQD